MSRRLKRGRTPTTGVTSDGHVGLSVVFWNVNGFMNISDVSDNIENWDILCISETWLTLPPTFLPEWISKHQFNYSNAVREFKTGRPRGGLSIITKKSLLLKSIIFQNDYCLFILFKKFNQDIIIGLIYFSPSLNDETCRLSLELAMDHVEKLNMCCPIIIGGDLNERVGDLNQVDEVVMSECAANLYGMRMSLDGKINSRGKLLIEFFEDHSFMLLNGRSRGDTPASYTYCGKRGNSTVDLIFCNFEYLQAVSDLYVYPLVTQSDHLPVVLSLYETQNRIGGNQRQLGGRSMGRGFKWKENLGGDYAERMSWQPNVQWKKGPLDFANDELISTVTRVAESLGLRCSDRKIANKPWFNKECHLQKIKVKQALKECLTSNFNPDTKNIYIKEKKLIKNLIQKNKKLYEDNIKKEISETRYPSTFWRAVNKFKPRTSGLDHVGTETWNEYLEDMFPPRVVFATDLFDAKHPLLDSEVSYEELCATLAECKNGKASGPDGLSFEFFKGLPSNWLLYLQTLFNEVINQETVPKAWGQAHAFMIHKKGVKTEPKNYRCIALMNTVAKVFTQILNGRLKKWADYTGSIPEFQSGFRDKRGCLYFHVKLIGSNSSESEKGQTFRLLCGFRKRFSLSSP